MALQGTKSSIIERARQIAYIAHKDRVSDEERPYIESVMEFVNSLKGNEKVKATAWLCGVLEKAPEQFHVRVYDFADQDVAWACCLLSDLFNNDIDRNLKRVEDNVIARKVHEHFMAMVS